METKKKLQRLYFILALPAVAANIILYLAISSIPLPFIKILSSISYGTLGTIVLCLSAAASLALPILYRSFFAGKVSGRQFIGSGEFFKFQERMILIAMSAPWVSACGILLRLSGLYLYGPVLMALYALYFYYPSEKKIDYDKKLFRMRYDENTAP